MTAKEIIVELTQTLAESADATFALEQENARLKQRVTDLEYQLGAMMAAAALRRATEKAKEAL